MATRSTQFQFFRFFFLSFAILSLAVFMQSCKPRKSNLRKDSSLRDLSVANTKDNQFTLTWVSKVNNQEHLCHGYCGNINPRTIGNVGDRRLACKQALPNGNPGLTSAPLRAFDFNQKGFDSTKYQAALKYIRNPEANAGVENLDYLKAILQALEILKSEEKNARSANTDGNGIEEGTLATDESICFPNLTASAPEDAIDPGPSGGGAVNNEAVASGVKQNGSCSFDSECDQGLICDVASKTDGAKKTCFTPPEKILDKCVSRCGKGLYCHKEQFTCVDPKYLDSFAGCGSELDCKEGKLCRRENASVRYEHNGHLIYDKKICMRPSERGEYCEMDRHCKKGLHCYAGQLEVERMCDIVVAGKKGAGQRCATANDCLPDMTCIERGGYDRI